MADRLDDPLYNEWFWEQRRKNMVERHGTDEMFSGISIEIDNLPPDDEFGHWSFVDADGWNLRISGEYSSSCKFAKREYHRNQHTNFGQLYCSKIPPLRQGIPTK